LPGFSPIFDINGVLKGLKAMRDMDVAVDWRRFGRKLPEKRRTLPCEMERLSHFENPKSLLTLPTCRVSTFHRIDTGLFQGYFGL
jgi:hypothetical protein